MNQVRARTLEVYWDTTEKQLFFKCKDNRDVVTTKREALSVTANVFEPLGIALPVTIKTRLLIQQLWKTKCGSDGKIPERMEWEWLYIYKNAQECVQVKIPRQVFARKVTFAYFQ